MTSAQRKPKKSTNRPRWLLERLVNFIDVNGAWPTMGQMLNYISEGAERRTTRWRQLRALEKVGVVAQAPLRTWAVTSEGFKELGKRPITPRFDRKPRHPSRREIDARTQATRLAVHDVFEQSSGEGERPPWIPEPPQTRYNDLDLVE